MLKTTRHKIEMQYENTDNIKSKIEACQYLKQQFHGNRVSRYLIDYKGYPIEIRVMPEKIAGFCTSNSLLQEFLDLFL